MEQDAVIAHLPDELYPQGATAGWWAKTVQLDLEAKGTVVREFTKPLRWHQIWQRHQFKRKIMTTEQQTLSTIYQGWNTYQSAVVRALQPLTAEQLDLRAAPRRRSVGQIAAHIIGARARWFRQLMGEGGDEFAALGRWDRRGARPRTAAELVQGLEATWQGMHAAIARWTAEEWQQTWPGEDDSEPEVITRPWVIWHLIEHDVHHGGEISLTLGTHGVPALDL